MTVAEFREKLDSICYDGYGDRELELMLQSKTGSTVYEKVDINSVQYYETEDSIIGLLIKRKTHTYDLPPIVIK